MKLLYAIVIAFVLFVFYAIYQEEQACRAKGGVIVKGLYSYSCLKIGVHTQGVFK